VKPLLDLRVLESIVEPLGFAAADLRWIRSSQNCVYECAGDRPSIIRVSHGRGRTLEQVEAELAWIDDLAALGLPVCPAIPSPAGRRCERMVANGQEYLVVQFQRAPGRKVELAESDAAMYGHLGQLTGRLHEASFGRQSETETCYARPLWHESRLLRSDLERYAAAQVGFRTQVRQLVSSLAEQTHQALGLVHADIHFGNLFVDHGQLWIFDFDNCEYGTVEQDLATVLYDAIYCRVLMTVPPDGRSEAIASRWGSFFRGYCSLRGHDSVDRALLGQFLVLREAIIYLHYHRVLDMPKVAPSFLAGLEEMRQNVERGKPAFSIDFL
jgi:Ser/Thr protein kinase RdoA (MazF antagonist)